MGMVQQTPDGHVIVRSDSYVYIDTVANFTLDFGEVAPVLPAGAHDRIYEPGVRHPMTDGMTIVAVGEMPWDAGDRYIANIVMGLENQVNRIANAPITPPSGAKMMPMTADLETKLRDMRETARMKLRAKRGLR